MKIIKQGKLNTNVKCKFCGCEYEFDVNDIQEETNIQYLSIQYYSPQPPSRIRYVCCPMCKLRTSLEVNKEKNNESI